MAAKIGSERFVQGWRHLWDFGPAVLVHRGGPRPVLADDANVIIAELQALPALLEAWT